MNVLARRRAGFTLIELLVVIAIIAVLIALLLPAVQAAREAARRSQCCNNLMQLGIALKSYESSHEVLPPGVVNPTGPIRNAPPGYHVSWVLQIMPFIEQRTVFNNWNFLGSVYDQTNSTCRSIQVRVLLCPSDATGGSGDFGALTSYAGCHHDTESPIAADNKGVLFLNSKIAYEDLEDGSSNTIFAGEKHISTLELGWASGTRSTLRNTGTSINKVILITGANKDPVGGYSSFHPGGANFLLGDGSVRFLKAAMSVRIYRALGNRADGEMLSADAF